MDSPQRCENRCERHAVQRSLYRHALNALQLASRSDCGSEEMRELARRCAELLDSAAGDDDAETGVASVSGLEVLARR